MLKTIDGAFTRSVPDARNTQQGTAISMYYYHLRELVQVATINNVVSVRCNTLLSAHVRDCNILCPTLQKVSAHLYQAPTFPQSIQPIHSSSFSG